MSLVEHILEQTPPAGISLEERAKVGSPSAKEKVQDLLTKPVISTSLSVNQWAELGLEKAQETKERILDLL